jgi:hypothetical protein
MADGIFTEDELKADQTTVLTEPVVEETAEQKAERERDEQGRFKAKEPEEVVAAPEVEEGKEKGGTVPQQALHAEREKRKAAEVELSSLREQLGAIQKMREQVASRKPEELPAADDPAAVEHLRKRLAEVEQTTTNIAQARDNEALNQRELQQLGGFMHQSETAFREKQPDYDAAIEHVVNARARELSLYGLTVPQIQQTIAEEATDIVRSAVAQGRDPAELGYEIARSRGYQPKPTDTNQDRTDPSKANGGAQAVLDAIAAAKAQGKSLGSGGGAAPKTLTIEAVNSLSPEEFDAIYSTPEGKRMIDGL